MALDPAIKKNWIEIQKRHDYPVNAIGVRIDPKDEMTLRVWRDEGIDAHVKGK
ncbi:MAG: hypothetical protein KDD47_01715 [Acidobacteria bacterium]|nr:hypothetical protein [Acidobacteriota bacterium]